MRINAYRIAEMSFRNNMKQAWWLMCVGVILSACTASGPDILATDLSNTETLSVPSALSMTPPVTTMTRIPSISPTPSVTASPLSLTPTPAPLPTFSPTEAYLLVEELLVTNGGCELPCWWSIQPGETSWAEAEAFLSSFAWKIESGPHHKGVIEYDVYFPLSDPPTWQESRGLSLDVNDDGIVTLITTDMKYPLRELLTRFKVPTQLWVSAYEVPIKDKFEYELYLLYPEQGVMGRYGGYGDIATITDQKRVYTFCSSTFAHGGYGLTLWKPDPPKSFQQILSTRRTDLEQLERYKRLSDISHWDESSFFEVFSAATPTTCLEIPIMAVGGQQ